MKGLHLVEDKLEGNCISIIASPPLYEDLDNKCFVL